MSSVERVRSIPCLTLCDGTLAECPCLRLTTTVFFLGFRVFYNISPCLLAVTPPLLRAAVVLSAARFQAAGVAAGAVRSAVLWGLVLILSGRSQAQSVMTVPLVADAVITADRVGVPSETQRQLCRTLLLHSDAVNSAASLPHLIVVLWRRRRRWQRGAAAAVAAAAEEAGALGVAIAAGHRIRRQTAVRQQKAGGTGGLRAQRRRYVHDSVAAGVGVPAGAAAAAAAGAGSCGNGICLRACSMWQARERVLQSITESVRKVTLA